MTQRAFGSRLAVSAASLAAGAGAEAVVCALRGGPADAAWCLGLWALPITAAAFGGAWLLALFCDEGALTWRIVGTWAHRPARDAVLLALAGSSLLGALVFCASVASFRFHNRELFAAGLALTTALAAVVLGAGGYRLWPRLRSKHPRVVPLVTLAVCLGTWLPIAWQSASGLLQLDPRLSAAPAASAIAFGALDRSERWRRRSRALWAGTLGVLAALGVLFLGAPSSTTARLAVNGAWTRPLIGALQGATDFDRDGYSNLLGGGDCAPFDARVNPGAIEVPNDGIDNNCVGGDGGRASAPRRPIWGSSTHGAPADLNVVIVTIETLRRDHASFIQARHDTTPNLRGLAASSLVFERMYSAAPYTRLALASLFSSLAPSEIEWQLLNPEKHMRHIAPSTPWLPELLRARGYETIAVLSDFSAFTPQEDIGFERGFQHYDTSTQLEYRGGTMRGFPAAAQVDKALGYLRRSPRPFLLWLHLFEPHFRYEQPPGAPVFGADEQSRYDAEIWHVDHELGRLFDALRSLEVWDRSVLFVSGDHGEAFGEHDDRWHGTNLFDPQLRPAALLRVPGIGGKRVSVDVTFTDIAPTLARVLGDRQTFEQLRGRSLAPLMHHSALPDGQPGFVAETFNIEDGRAYQAAFVAQPFKLIYTEQGQRFALYDLATDPGERRPLDPRADPRAAPLLSELVGYLERARPRALTAR